MTSDIPNYAYTGKVYAHHVHCGLQAERRPGQNIPSGEGQSCEATTRGEKLSLLLSSKKLVWSFQWQEQNYYSNFALFSLFFLSFSLSLPPLSPQLLAGASDRLLGDLQLVRDPSKYRYLSGTKHTANDEHMYSEVLKSMMV